MYVTLELREQGKAGAERINFLVGVVVVSVENVAFTEFVLIPFTVKFSLLKFKPFIFNSINSLLIVPCPQGLVVAGGVVGVVLL